MLHHIFKIIAKLEYEIEKKRMIYWLRRVNVWCLLNEVPYIVLIVLIEFVCSQTVALIWTGPDKGLLASHITWSFYACLYKWGPKTLNDMDIEGHAHIQSKGPLKRWIYTNSEFWVIYSWLKTSWFEALFLTLKTLCCYTCIISLHFDY